MTGPEASADGLRALLGAAPPGSIGSLDADARAQLAAILDEARQRQAAAIDEAFAAALKHVPFPARGIVKKALQG